MRPAFYWVRWSLDHEWEVARWDGHQWWLIGCAQPVIGQPVQHVGLHPPVGAHGGW
jgi:hypothetical protein